MKRYAINYGRSFPDHRVPVDYHFNRELTKGYSSYFRFLKDGFNSMAIKNFHILLAIYSTAAFTFAAFWVYGKDDFADVNINKKTFPCFKYAIMSNRGGFGAYDTILQKFQNEKGGIRDLPWKE